MHPLASQGGGREIASQIVNGSVHGLVASALRGIHSYLQTVVLDKTGTITRGEPVLTDVVPGPGFAEAELIVASAERGREHPLGEAIVRVAAERGIELVEARDFNAVAGPGIEASVAGRRLLLGNAKLRSDRGVAWMVPRGASFDSPKRWPQ